jgi:hypothetical protein
MKDLKAVSQKTQILTVAFVIKTVAAGCKCKQSWPCLILNVIGYVVQ